MISNKEIMRVEYREIAFEDRHTIREIIGKVVAIPGNLEKLAEIWIKDPTCVFYGAFKGRQLVGFGNLRRKSKKLAWIEWIRVHYEYQRQGIGTELFRVGVETARKQQCKSVGYATHAGNQGSCRIGEKLGFQLRAEMKGLYCRPTDIPIKDDEFFKQEPITIEEAINLLEKIPDGPREEICIGWNFAPIDVEFFEKEPDMKFYAVGETILLEYHERNPVSKEVNYVKASIYGSKDDAHKLLSGFVRRNYGWEGLFMCLCPEELVAVLQDFGFQYSGNTFVLFKKNLQVT